MLGAVAELTVKEGSQAEFEKVALELEAEGYDQTVAAARNQSQTAR